MEGDPYADFYLSMSYSNGISVTPDDALAFSYMLKAANGGESLYLELDAKTLDCHGALRGLAMTWIERGGEWWDA